MFTFEGTTVENGVTVNLYNVRYYNSAGVAKYVTVNTELPTLNGSFDDPINGVLWVALAEKAYAQANAFGFVTTNEPNLTATLPLTTVATSAIQMRVAARRSGRYKPSPEKKRRWRP